MHDANLLLGPFFQKLHKNEKNCTKRASPVFPPNLPMIIIVEIFMF